MTETLAQCIEEGRRGDWDSRRDAVPEGTHSIDAIFRRIAGNQGAVDGSDGYSSDPVRRITRLGHPLEHSRLIGAECSSTLQREDDVIVSTTGAMHIHGDCLVSLSRSRCREESLGVTKAENRLFPRSTQL